tara:strand:+ start:648 stop:1046 length:399 start_codon:yes stop_codon:yes gene_type:complete
MDDLLIKHIFPLGEIIERYLINEIKIEKLPEDKSNQIKAENVYFEDAIELMTHDLDEMILRKFTDELCDVLLEQWEILDKCYAENVSDSERGKLAFEAQEINRVRIAAKNKINQLAGFVTEHKQYGDRNEVL